MKLTREQLIRRVENRVRRLQPDIVTALLASFRRLQGELSDSDLVDLAKGIVPVESLLGDTVLRRAFLPYQVALRKATERGSDMVLADLPTFAGKAKPTAAAFFNFLEPKIIEGVRALENRALDTLTDNVKEVTRAFVENGIRDGKNPRETARQLRKVIDIAPHQQRYVANLERELRSLSPDFKQRVLRDRRYDSQILKAIKDGKPLTDAQIEKITGAYTRRFAAHNTEVVTRQATLDTYRLSQRLTWEESIRNGYVDAGVLWKVWVHSDIVDQPRPEHVALNGTAVPFDQPYPNGQMSAGEGDFGCRCTDRFEVRVGARQTAGSRRSGAGLF
jgi:uncharacterized protein with gpF-like domain